MNLPSTLAVLTISLALSAAAASAQDAPRLDGSNVPQPVISLGPPPTATQPAPTATSHAAQPASHSKSKNAPGTAPVILVPPPPPTPADLPPVAASVFFSDGLLTVHAHNASLAQILQDTATQTGMQLEGTPQDQRIFGDFGPAPVPVVLGQLLDGGPSNYVLFGRNANLAPRSLVITPKSSLAPGQVAGIGKPAVTVNNEDDDDDDAPPVTNPQPGVHAIMPLRGGGNANPDQSGNPPARTPQQIIDEMQQRRQQQQLQQPGTPAETQ
jgi:hypothetical protein